MECISHSAEQTQHLAAHLSPILKQGDCITLQGDLGAGKTCFAKGLIHAFSGEHIDAITSPTFTLCQQYASAEDASFTLHHYDLYRLEDAQELEQLGFEESLEQGAALIEWPEIASDYLPDSRVEITISMGENDTRNITFIGHGEWLDRLADITLLQGTS